MINSRKRLVSMEWLEWNREPDTAALERATSIQDFYEAEAAYKLLIDQGSIFSMVNLGAWFEYKSDISGGPNFSQAELWYRRAVDSGSAVATLQAGYFYLRRNNYAKAREMFEIGSSRGYAPSMLRLGDLYAKGLGVERNYDIAHEFFKQASDRGNLWAKRTVAVLAARRNRNIATRCWWWINMAVAYLEFRCLNWREPHSERLKK